MKTKMKRIKPKRKTRKMYGGSPYTDILDQHFLTPVLDHIFHKTSLEGRFFRQGIKCNITMLGDMHNVITHQGTDMLTAFRNFTTDYTTHRASLPPLDIFIESTENSARNLYPTMQIDAAQQQIINVGIELERCHRAGACAFNLHWIDIHDVPVDKVSYLNPPCVGRPTIAVTKLPRWIYNLGRMHLTSPDILQALWRYDLSIRSKIRITEILGGIRFTDIQDCMKILTENCIIKREIAKATRVNPRFTYGYAKAALRELILRTSYSKNITLPAWVCRNVLEIYTLARIISKHMTHVIIYVGAAHSTFLSQMARTMGLRTIFHDDVVGTDAMPLAPNEGPYDNIPTYNNIPYNVNLRMLARESEDNDNAHMYVARPMDAYFIPPPALPQPPVGPPPQQAAMQQSQSPPQQAAMQQSQSPPQQAPLQQAAMQQSQSPPQQHHHFNRM